MVSGASPAYNIEEMTFALKKADAKSLMTVPSSMEVAAAAVRNAGIPSSRVGQSYDPEGQVPSFKIPRGKKNKDVCAFLSFSSGSTGLAKAVMIAHENLVAQCLQIRLITPPDPQKIIAMLSTFHSMRSPRSMLLVVMTTDKGQSLA